MRKDKVIVGISQGDINGIGYEVIIKTLLDNRIYEICTPIVYGSPKIAAYHRKALNINNFSLNIIKHASEANLKRANIINCNDENVRVELGKSTKTAGDAAFQALDRAVRDLKNGDIDVLVTAPINKKNIQSEAFNYPGHTEYLEEKSDEGSAIMLMVSDVMRVGVVAGHVPVFKLSEYITKDNILKKLRLLNQTLIQDFGINNPVIAVFGLNPHAGDNGLIGTEENEIIIPAINTAKEEGIVAIGPYPADGFFGATGINKFDAILAMYHDQGLAPFKAISFKDGVNYTGGLSFVRTSPAHGTALEIAGKNVASENSFRQALYLAVDSFKKRKEYFELKKSSLTKDKESNVKKQADKYV